MCVQSAFMSERPTWWNFQVQRGGAMVRDACKIISPRRFKNSMIIIIIINIIFHYIVLFSLSLSPSFISFYFMRFPIWSQTIKSKKKKPTIMMITKISWNTKHEKYALMLLTYHIACHIPFEIQNKRNKKKNLPTLIAAFIHIWYINIWSTFTYYS